MVTAFATPRSASVPTWASKCSTTAHRAGGLTRAKRRLNLSPMSNTRDPATTATPAAHPQAAHPPAPAQAELWGLNFSGAFIRGAVWSTLGLAAAHVVFPGEAPIVSVILIALGQANYVEALLDRNRNEVYGGVLRAREANRRMARELVGLFLGIFAAYTLAVFVVKEAHLEQAFGSMLGEFYGTRLSQVDFGTFGLLMQRNLAVLLAGFLISLLYRHGGILLILAWNAARWGVVLGCVGRREVEAGGLGAGLAVSVVLPHLVFEALAYVLAAMAGAFLGRSLLRHKVGSPTFNNVGIAVLSLLGLSVVTLAVASAFEASLKLILGG